jgi:succinyl-CoA synthetase beta subunit
MKIHEYQAKDILQKFGVPVQRGKVVFKVEDIPEALKELGNPPYVVKAQIHAGGRGKGGGVKFAKTADDVVMHTKNMLGMTLVTPQTGPDGKVVKKVLIAEALDIKKELYLGITHDRSKRCPIIMASMEGGVEIEKVAAENPKAILKEWVSPETGFMPFIARRLAYGMGLEGKTASKMASFVEMLYNAFEKNDCSLAEINPLVITTSDDVIALDAKMNFDDNALFRHPEIVVLRDFDEENPLEVEAGKFGLNYIKLDGQVGCMVNGAGLAMATMDIIKLAGSMPANFLDVGGGANVEAVANAFRILTSDPEVKAVLINIFGGIVRCDRVAGGIIEALKVVDVKIPMVVRLEGTNAVEARQMIASAPHEFITASTMKDAAEKVVAALKS